MIGGVYLPNTNHRSPQNLIQELYQTKSPIKGYFKLQQKPIIIANQIVFIVQFNQCHYSHLPSNIIQSKFKTDFDNASQQANLNAKLVFLSYPYFLTPTDET